MAIDRRTFLFGLTATGLASGLAPALALSDTGRTRLISCRSNNDDQHFVAGLDYKGRITLDVALPARGHGFAVDPANSRVAVFARRPGDYVWILDTNRGEVVTRIAASPGRHFYGHGAFTNDGRLLCSENAYASGDGVIGVYDTRNDWQRLGEFPSHGTGPHQIMLTPDKRVLVVANGGIRTHPDLPRVKQNLASMRPNLAYVDMDGGQLLHRAEPPSKWHQLSIRHIDIAKDGRVAVAMQFEGNPLQQPPLVGLQKSDGPLELLTAQEGIQAGMRNYCGSVMFDTNGERFAVTSPRGGIVTYWSSSGEHIGQHRQADACGVAYSIYDNGFIVSDGSGALVRTKEDLTTELVSGHSATRWDNHLIKV